MPTAKDLQAEMLFRAMTIEINEGRELDKGII